MEPEEEKLRHWEFEDTLEIPEGKIKRDPDMLTTKQAMKELELAARTEH